MSYNTNNIDKVLGQRVDSPSTYTPEILVREERQRNRTHLNLKNGNLPFVGYDIWNGYECSAITDNGLPVACVAKVVYSSENDFIVQTKSFGDWYFAIYCDKEDILDKNYDKIFDILQKMYNQHIIRYASIHI